MLRPCARATHDICPPPSAYTHPGAVGEWQVTQKQDMNGTVILKFSDEEEKSLHYAHKMKPREAYMLDQEKVSKNRGKFDKAVLEAVKWNGSIILGKVSEYFTRVEEEEEVKLPRACTGEYKRISKRYENRSETMVPGADAAGGEESERALNEDIVERAIAKMNELHEQEEGVDKEKETKGTPGKKTKSEDKQTPKRKTESTPTPGKGPTETGVARKSRAKRVRPLEIAPRDAILALARTLSDDDRAWVKEQL